MDENVFFYGIYDEFVGSVIHFPKFATLADMVTDSVVYVMSVYELCFPLVGSEKILMIKLMRGNSRVSVGHS